MADNMTVCSNQGECGCGECQCYEGYSGRYCDECPTCPSKCTPIFDCLQGRENCELDFVMRSVAQERICSMIDDNGCRLTFSYSKEGLSYQVNQEEKVCPSYLSFLQAVCSKVFQVLV